MADLAAEQRRGGAFGQPAADAGARREAGGGARPLIEAPSTVEPVMRALARAIDGLELPAVEKISESQEEDPFQVLIATLLSARTQDATTLAASTRLFKAGAHAADAWPR